MFFIAFNSIDSIAWWAGDSIAWWAGDRLLANGPARARAALGLGRAGGRLVFCIYFVYLGYILDIFGYIFGIFLVYEWTRK